MSGKVVGILGGGEWGFALAKAAQTAGNPVLVCTRRDGPARADGFEVTSDLHALGARTELIFLAVPSNVARAVASALGDHVDGRHMIVHGVRGLSDEGLKPLSEIVREETPARRVGAVGGPATAAALAAGSPAVIVVASRYPEVLDAVHHALASSSLRVSHTPDLTGLEWASALMGALMVALGYARAVGVTGGLLAGLMIRGVREAAQIAMLSGGAEERTFHGIAGVGDLMAAVASPDRPEVRFGEQLAKGESPETAARGLKIRIEAIDLVPRVLAWTADHRLHVPVFQSLGEVLAGRGRKETILAELMTPDAPRSHNTRA